MAGSSERESRTATEGLPIMRVPAAVLLGVTVWRAAIAALALTGFALYNQGRLINLVFLTQIGNLVCGVLFALLLIYPIFTLGRRHEPRTGFLRGANVVVMTIVMIVYMGPMGGDISETRDLLCHLVTPLLVVADWLFVGRNQQWCRAWYPLLWLVYPAAYLVFYTIYDPTFKDRYGQHIYPDFLEVGEGSYPGIVAALVAGTTLLAFFVFGIGRVKGALSTPAPPPPMPWPPNQPPSQPAYPPPYQQGPPPNQQPAPPY
ncbi:MAG TPA: hypothetical protein VHC49_09235 [Mycobacteriales bacterium]|nr:hypothetical protein [Mycobacteriales bacterium]